MSEVCFSDLVGDSRCFFSSRRRHTRYIGDWSSDVCSSDLNRRRGFSTGGTPMGRGITSWWGSPTLFPRSARSTAGRPRPKLINRSLRITWRFTGAARPSPQLHAGPVSSQTAVPCQRRGGELQAPRHPFGERQHFGRANVLRAARLQSAAEQHAVDGSGAVAITHAEFHAGAGARRIVALVRETEPHVERCRGAIVGQAPGGGGVGLEAQSGG